MFAIIHTLIYARLTLKNVLIHFLCVFNINLQPSNGHASKRALQVTRPIYHDDQLLPIAFLTERLPGTKMKI